MEKSFAGTYKVTSKEFWKNYWFYYKPHTIWGIIILITIVGTIHGCVTKTDPDVTFMYLGETPLSAEASYDASDVLGRYAADVNGDGVSSSLFINLPYGGGDINVAQSSFTTFDIELSEGDPFIFMLDEATFKRYIDINAFTYLDDLIAKHNIPADRVLYNNSGRAIAVNITGTNFGDIIGATSFPVYAGVKILPDRKSNDGEFVALYRESVSFYEKILADTVVMPKE